MSYIRYTVKTGGAEYAALAESVRNGVKVEQKYLENLGRVVDKERGIFKSRERGLFCYNDESGFSPLPENFSEAAFAEKERLILDFGDSFFLNEFLNAQTFADAFRSIFDAKCDTLFALIFYRILTDGKAYCYADEWLKGNYASLLFPKARLQSQRISEFLELLGDEEIQRGFFAEYFKSLYGGDATSSVLIDSTGIPNATNMDVTQFSNHNGDITLEARLIYVLDRKNNMPIYFRYCAGNIVDVSTLCTTLAELRQYNINVDYAIVDAGYFSEENVNELYQNSVKFVTRLAPHRKIYKETVAKLLNGLLSSKNAVRYGDRLVYIAKTEVDFYGNVGYVYIGIDSDSRNSQIKRATFEAFDDKLTPEQTDEKIAKLGLFAIASSENLSTNEILPLYYTRQQIEQVFDVSKNNADVIPIRVQNEKTFRGHLMLTFLATVVIQKLQRDILSKRDKKSKVNPEGAFLSLRNQKCKVFDKEIVPQEAMKTHNDVYRLFGIKCPATIGKM